MIPLSVAEVAVEEAMTTGLKMGCVLSSKQINVLWDVAVRIGEGKPLEGDDALALMKMALQSRPDDELLQQYAEQRGQESGAEAMEDRSGVLAWLARVQRGITSGRKE